MIKFEYDLKAVKLMNFVKTTRV